MLKSKGIIKMSLWDEKEAKRLFQELPFYNFLIKKAKIKTLKNICFLHELPFYNELSIAKISEVLNRYARSYKAEIANSNDPLAQLKASNLSIEDLI